MRHPRKRDIEEVVAPSKERGASGQQKHHCGPSLEKQLRGLVQRAEQATVDGRGRIETTTRFANFR